MDLQKRLLAQIRKADHDFNLISDNDHILVGVSGGKDSTVLCYLLSLYQKFSDKNFTFTPVFLDLGFPKSKKTTEEFNRLIKFFSDHNMELHVEDSRDVYKILDLHRKKVDNSLECSICSRMKKASINKVANKLGYTKVSFAHHMDDCIETLFMNMTYGGKLNTFEAKMYLEKAGITFIRPMIYIREEDIVTLCSKEEVPIVTSSCPNDKYTKRESFKTFLNDYYSKYPSSYTNFAKMLLNEKQTKLLYQNKGYSSIKEDLFIKEVSTKDQYVDSLTVRNKVFIEEEQIPFSDEFDDKEKVSTYFNLYYKDQIVGTLRIYFVEDEDGEDGSKHRNFKVQLGRFAILKKYRNRGFGSFFYNYIASMLTTTLFPLEIRINAQVRYKDFYSSLGFKVDETDPNEYDECGIPHIKMYQKYSKPFNIKQVKYNKKEEEEHK